MKSSVTASSTGAEVRAHWWAPRGYRGTVILDTEVYDSRNTKVAQWFSTRSVRPGTGVTLRMAWNLRGVEDGTYTVKQGVFDADWAPTIAWNNDSTRVEVRGHAVKTVDAPAATTTTKAPAAPPTTRPATPPTTRPPAPRPATPASGNPLGGASFFGTNAGAAAQASAWANARPADAELLRRLAAVPSATWLGSWSGDITSATGNTVAQARRAGTVPVFVAYNIPNRDCGGYSAGGLSSESQYNQWIDGLAAGIGSAKAVVVLEPDALAGPCGDVDARYRMISRAVDVLTGRSGALVYIDAGNPTWVDPATMASRLRAANVAKAAGFSINVSNFAPTGDATAYGERISALVGGKGYVVDTSRNGNGSNGEWCNPSGRAVGTAPTTNTGAAHAHAFLWLKTPGESDGTCNGGPAAGVFWPEYALGLTKAAWR